MRLAAILLVSFTTHSSLLAADELVLYVAPGGNDAWSGLLAEPDVDSDDGPFATLERAQAAVREAWTDVVVSLRAGTYVLERPLVFGPADGLSPERTVTWRAHRDERVVLSGGRILADWRVEEDGTWTHAAPVPHPRQLFVSGERRPRARLPRAGWLRVEAPGSDRRSSFTYGPGELSAWPDLAGADLVFLHDWSMSRVGIAAIDETTRRVQLAHPVGAWHPFFHITGFEAHPRYAVENLRVAWETPEGRNGEWYFDRARERIHYRPLAGEEPGATHAVIPVLDRLIEIRGEGKRPVRGIRFAGLTFSHTRTVAPYRGYAGIQAAFHADRSVGARPQSMMPAPCAVSVTDAVDCRFIDCSFQQLGGTALSLGEGTRDSLVRSCTVTDVGANGVMVGETGEPARPAGLVSNIVCEDNTIERCGVVCLGAVGVWVGIAEKVTVRHNEVRELPYTGVSLGWIWSPRPSPSRGHRIERNHIHHVMQVLSDGGGIYTLGRQPDTLLRHNWIHDVPRHAGRAPSNGFFIDEGSCELVVEGNVIHSIAGSPIRFHKAGSNVLRANVLVTAEENPPFFYNACSADTMVFEDNRVVDPEGWSAPTSEVLEVGPRSHAAGERDQQASDQKDE